MTGSDGGFGAHESHVGPLRPGLGPMRLPVRTTGHKLGVSYAYI